MIVLFPCRTHLICVTFFSEMTTRKPKPVCEYIVVLTMELFISIMVPMLSNGLCPYNIIGPDKQNI